MQRHDIVVDACIVGPSHSSLLQQACQLTGGIYSKPTRPSVLLEYLLVRAAPQSLILDSVLKISLVLLTDALYAERSPYIA